MTDTPDPTLPPGVAHDPRERSQAVDRAVALMDVLSDGGPRSITQLAAELDVSRGAVYRMINTMAEHGWVRRTDDAGVQIGLGVLRIGAGVLPFVRSVSRGVLHHVADAVGATAHMTIAEGNRARALVVVEPSWTDWHVAYRVGSSHALTQGAAGKAILRARQGYSGCVSTAGELQPGAVGMAVALQVPGVEASLGVVAMSPLDQARTEAVLENAAVALARRLV